MFAESVTILSRGKALCRSDANCSPIHSDTSQPVTSRSTEPSCVPSSCCISRFLIFEKSVKTVSRLSELDGSFQSSWIFLMIRGMSAMSEPTASLSPSLGSGSTNGLPPSRSTRLNRGSFEPLRPVMNVYARTEPTPSGPKRITCAM